MSVKLMLMIFLVASLTACATSSDPRQGGLFGYLAHHDEYDARIQQRRQELDRQQNVNQQLAEDSKTLDRQVQQRESELALDRQRLNRMQGDLSRLETDVNRLQAKTRKQKSDIASLKGKISVQRKRLKSHDAALKELERSGGRDTDPERYLALEQERNRLAKEYKLLLEYSQALAKAAK